MAKISVITPTIRPEGLQITQKGLSRQSFTDFEWLVELGIPERGHDLNSAYNRALRRATGELVVSLQDYITVTPQFLEKWWKAYQDHPDTFMTAPVGKNPQKDYGGNTVWDWRAYRNDENASFRPCEWNCWEIDNGAAPLAALKQIGGFDEALDGHWSADNVNVGCRAQLAGYKFGCLFDNPGIAYDHDAFTPHPFRESFDGSFNTKRMAMFRGGMTLPPLH
jgi:hypothetical protein